MKPIEEAAEMVLRAAGSSLKNYTMPATREAILQAITDVRKDAYIAGSNAYHASLSEAKP